MDIKESFINKKIETAVEESLENGEIITIQDMGDKILETTELLEDVDPIFNTENHKLTEKEISSASKINSFQKEVKESLDILYKQLLYQTDNISSSYDLWRSESKKLEKQLASLENRITNLILLTKNSDGYSSFFIDDFKNNVYVDGTLTTAYYDNNEQMVTIPKENDSTLTKIYLDSLEKTDISFNIKTTENIVTTTYTGKLEDLFKQVSSHWAATIKSAHTRPVICELLVKISDEPISLNKISMSVHSSNKTPLNVLPLYSVDNYNFYQLPTVNYMKDISSSGVFSFNTTQVKYIKFILTKNSPDSLSQNVYSYIIGFKEVSFYNSTYAKDTQSLFISEPISVIDPSSNEILEFSKVSLEVCEKVEENTSIEYSVVANNTSSFEIDSNTEWISISPTTRNEITHPKIINFSDLSDISLENVGISYDPSGEEDYISPKKTFTLVSDSGSTLPTEETITATDVRYFLPSSKFAILDHQIKNTNFIGSGSGTGLNIFENNIEIFRNIGAKGLSTQTSGSLVRGNLKGWSFQDPYYSCYIQILTASGLTIDFGNQTIIIDEKKYNGVVGPEVLSGKDDTKTGIHKVKVHKDNWYEVSSSYIYSKQTLSQADLLYPYNHKLLIEGFDYPSYYSSIDEKIYTGVDSFFEIYMKRASIFDLYNNSEETDYLHYSIDGDITNTHTLENSPTKVFVIRINDNISDFINEEFVIKFNVVNQKYKYLRLRAQFESSSSTLAPTLSSYKIKFGD